MANPTQQSDDQIGELPRPSTSPPSNMQLGNFSAMWWLTLLSLLLAIGLVWFSLPERGVDIVVRFPEGHGLQTEDQVLYRGIEVGFVKDVELGSDLSLVEVQIQLNSSASDLAREGTRFWIVRPQLSLSRIAGLETAVGHKYVSLSPGPIEAKRVYDFDGLVDPPPTNAARPGIEIVIRGDKRFSVSPGSMVTFRGVEVGRILSVNLSQDSRYVDIRAKIFEKYQQNVTTSSRFWSSSGINFELSLAEGLKFDSESLASIAQGGVSFLTVASDGKPVSVGHVFKLHPRPEDEWLIAADSVSSTNIELGGVLKLKKEWQQKGLIGIGKRTRSVILNGVPVNLPNNGKCLVVPFGLGEFSEKALPDSKTIIAFTQSGQNSVSHEEERLEKSKLDSNLGIMRWPELDNVDWLSKEDFRVPSEVETVLAVRSNVGDSEITYLHYPIECSYMCEDWSLPHFDGDRDLWNGAPVLSAKDGKVVGILITDSEQPRIVPYQPELFE